MGTRALASLCILSKKLSLHWQLSRKSSCCVPINPLIALPALVMESVWVDVRLIVTCDLAQQLDFLVDSLSKAVIKAATNYQFYSTVEMQLVLKRKWKCLLSTRTQYPVTVLHLVTHNPGTQTIQIRLLGITSSTLGFLGRHSCECVLVGELVHSFPARAGFSSVIVL